MLSADCIHPELSTASRGDLSLIAQLGSARLRQAGGDGGGANQHVPLLSEQSRHPPLHGDSSRARDKEVSASWGGEARASVCVSQGGGGGEQKGVWQELFSFLSSSMFLISLFCFHLLDHSRLLFFFF